LVNDNDVLLYSFVLLLRWMLNLVEKRSNACDGDGEWAFTALILTHLNDEWFAHFVGSKNTRRTQQEKIIEKRVNKRKKISFFTLFLAHLSFLFELFARTRHVIHV
jgi:hypothetical protein